MNIFEMLEKRELKPTDEFSRLVNLFNAQWDKNLYEKTSLKNFINGHLPQLPIRQTYLLVDEILSDLSISEDALYGVQWTTLFTYCELLFNLINQARGFIKKDEIASTFAKVIEDNIATILIKTNHRWAKIKEGYIIVDKNPAATEAVECLEERDSDLALKMIEYNRVLLKGNLERKREILISMAGYVEPMKMLFKGTDYSTLYDDSRNWVNHLNIRHNNSGNNSIPEYAKKWKSKDYEEWYDKIYHTLLMVILAKKQLEIKREFNKLKSTGETK